MFHWVCAAKKARDADWSSAWACQRWDKTQQTRWSAQTLLHRAAVFPGGGEENLNSSSFEFSIVSLSEWQGAVFRCFSKSHFTFQRMLESVKSTSQTWNAHSTAEAAELFQIHKVYTEWSRGPLQTIGLLFRDVPGKKTLSNVHFLYINLSYVVPPLHVSVLAQHINTNYCGY